jgi:hypothetical protein
LVNESENIDPISNSINIQTDASQKNERKTQKPYEMSKVQEDDISLVIHAPHLSSELAGKRLDNERKITLMSITRDVESSVATSSHQPWEANAMVQTADRMNRIHREIGCQTNDEDFTCPTCSKIFVADKNVDFKNHPAGSGLTRVHPIPYQLLLNDIVRIRLDRLHLEVIVK